jgi:hypothetical protein
MVLGSLLAFLLLTRVELCPDSEGATKLSGRFTGFGTLSSEDAKVPIRLSNNLKKLQIHRRIWLVQH